MYIHGTAHNYVRRKTRTFIKWRSGANKRFVGSKDEKTPQNLSGTIGVTGVQNLLGAIREQCTQ